MKQKLLAFSLTLACVASATAGTLTNGYYRVQNKVTNRHIYVCDNRGSVNATATTADVRALQAWRNPERVFSDPACVIYFEQQGSQWDLQAQGTGVAKILEVFVDIRGMSDGSYLCSGSNSGLTKYLADIQNSDDDMGVMSIDGKGDNRKWWVKPVTTADDSYFGIKPTITASGKYYTTFYASFPYKAYSTGVNFFGITKVDKGMAVISPISGAIPAGVPVIAECSSSDPSKNRLEIGVSASNVSSNLLRGVYFNSSVPDHVNRVAFNPATMRVLSADSKGKLVFTSESQLDYIPANTAYITVPTGTPSVVKVVTQAEYDAAIPYIPTSVSIDRTNFSLNKGESLKLNAKILPTTASNDAVKWSSSNSSVASVSSDGTVTAREKGTATITVTTSNNLTATVTVTVNVEAVVTEVKVSPASYSMYENETVSLSATVLPAEVADKSVTWSSSNTAVATVTSDGRVTSKTQGNCEIYATAKNGVRGVCKLQVNHKVIPVESITLTMPEVRLYQGEKTKLGYTIYPTNADDKTVTWSTSNPSVVSVDQNGEINALVPGTAVITATAQGKTATCKVTVVRRSIPVESVTLDNTSLDLSVGDQAMLQATVNPENADEKNVVWTSSDVTVATVSAIGRVTAKNVGNAIITAECGGKTAECSVNVHAKQIPVSGIILSRSSLSLLEGESGVLVATVLPSNATDKAVSWISSDSAVATVDENGKVTAVAKGNAVITATAGDFSATCDVKVMQKTEDIILPESVTITGMPTRLRKGDKAYLMAVVNPSNATDKSVQWFSADENVATVNSDGVVTAVGGGRTQITASTSNGIQASVEAYVKVSVEGIVVSPQNFEAKLGTEFLIEWVISPADATNKEVFVTSSNEDVVTVSLDGVAKIHKEGTAVVRVTTQDGGYYGECTISGLSSLDELVKDPSNTPVFDMNGRMIKSMSTPESLRELPRGIYIIGNHKIIL